MSPLAALIFALMTQTASAPAAGAALGAPPVPSSADAQPAKSRPRGSFREGVEALRAGKHADALEILSALEGEDPDGAPPELLWDKALAAYGAGELHTSEASAEKAAARGGERFQRRRDFLRGNVGFRKAQAIEQQIDSAAAKAGAPGGGAPAAAPLPNPAEYDKAIAQAELARDAWIQAATGAGSLESEHLDAARRNVERALLKIEELKKKKEELETRKKEQEQQNQDQNKDQNKDQNQDQKKDQNQEEKPQSQPKDGKPESSPSDPKDSPQEQKPDEQEQKEEKPQQQPQGEPKELPQEQAQRLLDKLDEKEKQRREYLKARAKAVKVPKDW